MDSAGTFWAESVAIVRACCCCRVGPLSMAVVSCSSWRSRGVFPPQMPCCSLYVSAWSRQAALTGHSAQTRFALLVAPPGGGKNSSGSVCAHNASECHDGTSSVPVDGAAMAVSSESTCWVLSFGRPGRFEWVRRYRGTRTLHAARVSDGGIEPRLPMVPGTECAGDHWKAVWRVKCVRTRYD